MEIFVIINQALYDNSSYFDVVYATKTLSNAKGALGTIESDFLKSVESGETEFNYENLDIVEDERELTITDKVTGIFEKWTINSISLEE